jgi:hypothetical protein
MFGASLQALGFLDSLGRTIHRLNVIFDEVISLMDIFDKFFIIFMVFDEVIFDEASNPHHDDNSLFSLMDILFVEFC